MVDFACVIVAGTAPFAVADKVRVMAAIQCFAVATFRHAIMIAARFFALVPFGATIIPAGGLVLRASFDTGAVLAFFVRFATNFVLDTPIFPFGSRARVGDTFAVRIANFVGVATIVAALSLPGQANARIGGAFAFAVIACLAFRTTHVAAFKLGAGTFGYIAYIVRRAGHTVFLHAIAVRIFIRARYATAVRRFFATRFADGIQIAVVIQFATTSVAGA